MRLNVCAAGVAIFMRHDLKSRENKKPSEEGFMMVIACRLLLRSDFQLVAQQEVFIRFLVRRLHLDSLFKSCDRIDV